MSSTRMLSALVLAVLATACRAPQHATSGAADGKAAGKVYSTALSASQAQLVCLDDPRGTAFVDKSIQGAQEKARRLPDIADGWSSVGALWVRKARATSDAGYYLNVEGCATV